MALRFLQTQKHCNLLDLWTILVRDHFANYVNDYVRLKNLYSNRINQHVGLANNRAMLIPTMKYLMVTVDPVVAMELFLVAIVIAVQHV